MEHAGTGKFNFSPDSHIYFSFYETLWKLFYRNRILIPVFHKTIPHYSLLEVVRVTKNCRHHNSITPQLEGDTFDYFNERAQVVVCMNTFFIEILKCGQIIGTLDVN